MPALAEDRLHYLDVAQKFHRGKIPPQVRMFAQENQLIMDVPFVQCNDGTTHNIKRQTAQPVVEVTGFGQGNVSSKSKGAPDVEHCSMITGLSTTEVDVMEQGGKASELRAMEDMTFMDATQQKAEQLFLYGNRQSNELEINGFLTRFNKLSGTNKSRNVLDGGGTGNGTLCSILAVKWGAYIYGLYPEGTQGGYQKKILPERLKKLDNGRELLVADTRHKFYLGLSVEDWRGVARAGNIKVDDLANLANAQQPGSFNNLFHKFVQLKMRTRRVPGKLVFYAPEIVHEAMMRLAMEKSSAVVKVQEATTQFGNADGKMLELTWMSHPVRLADQMLQTEEQLAA